MKTSSFFITAFLLSFAATGFAQAIAAGSCTSAASTTINVRSAPYSASASDSTIDCGISRDLNSLICPHGTGDFRVGESIVIAKAGALPTISTPSVPSLNANCIFGQLAAKCATAGTIRYSYRIACIQESEDGRMTAASAAASIVQAPQHWGAETWGTKTHPLIYTHVAWNCPPNPNGGADFAAVYKSVGGGHYTFYTFAADGHSEFDDLGYPPIGTFTAADYGVPAVPSDAAVGSDVYTRIGAISGNTIILASRPYQPQYMNRQPAGGFPLRPARPQQSVSIYHDDTPAFQAAVVALRAMPSDLTKTLFIPRGRYNIFPGDQFGAFGALNIKGIDNLDIVGDPKWASRIYFRSSRTRFNAFLYDIRGWERNDAPSLNLGHIMDGRFNGRTHFPEYRLSDPALVGQSYVILMNPADASNFQRDDIVALGIECDPGAACSPQGYPGSNLYAELNQVAAVASASGTLSLKWRLDKSFSNNLALTPTEASCHHNGCTGIPYIINNRSTDNAGHRGWLVNNHVSIDGIWFDGPGYFWQSYTNIDLSVTNSRLRGDRPLSTGGGRGYLARNNEIIDESAVNFDIWFGNASMENLHYVSNRISGGVFAGCIEGTVDELLDSNLITIDRPMARLGNPNQLVLFDSGSYCSGFFLRNNVFLLSNTNLAAIAENDFIAPRLEGNTFIRSNELDLTSGWKSPSTFAGIGNKIVDLTDPSRSLEIK